MVARPPFLVGTSGFMYDHWDGAFYPHSSRRGDWLELYAEAFPTVELNVTFYRLPAASTFRGWGERVPQGFVFAIKASRYITHVLRLRSTQDAVELLMERATGLGDRLGPVLLQLPPDLPIDLEGLASTLGAFRQG